MRSLSNFLLAGMAIAFQGVEATPMKDKCPQPVGKSIYFITNNEINQVAAIPISRDGTLSGGALTPTKGKGSNLVAPDTGKPNKPDALASQAAIQVAGDYLFAVNAGSNSLSMFSISKHDSTELRMVGEPATVPGDFPNTVAASDKNKIVCVATTGARAGVSCASYDDDGISEMDDLRTFDELEQSDPPTGPTNTVSQAFWSEDETALFVMVKGDPPSGKVGYLATFAVESTSSACGDMTTVSEESVRSSPNGTAVLFGSEQITGTDKIFFSDASFGGGILEIGDDLSASLLQKQTIEGQMATCWTTISPVSKTAFVTDVLVPRLVEMDLSDASIVGIHDVSEAGVTGLIDLKAAGNFIYSLAPGDGSSTAKVVVTKNKKRGQLSVVQSFPVGKLGAGGNSQGMAVYM